MWHKSTGTLRFGLIDSKYKLVVDVDPGIVAVARALTPIKLNTTRYSPHISVIRHEIPVSNLDYWAKEEGRRVNFVYSPIVYDDDKYYWLNVLSQDLIDIRVSFGLPASSLKSRPPDGTETFHITIGNTKDIS